MFGIKFYSNRRSSSSHPFLYSLFIQRENTCIPRSAFGKTIPTAIHPSRRTRSHSFIAHPRACRTNLSGTASNRFVSSLLRWYSSGWEEGIWVRAAARAKNEYHHRYARETSAAFRADCRIRRRSGLRFSVRRRYGLFCCCCFGIDVSYILILLLSLSSNVTIEILLLQLIGYLTWAFETRWCGY